MGWSKVERIVEKCGKSESLGRWQLVVCLQQDLCPAAYHRLTTSFAVLDGDVRLKGLWAMLNRHTSGAFVQSKDVLHC